MAKDDGRFVARSAPTVRVEHVEDGRYHRRAWRNVLPEMVGEEGLELVAEVRTNCSCNGRPRRARFEAGHVRLGGVGTLAREQE